MEHLPIRLWRATAPAIPLLGMTLGLLSGAALASAAPVESNTERRAITHEDIWLMPRVAPAAVSPDGTQAVLPVLQPSYDPQQQSMDLWLVATDGASPPRRITHSHHPEVDPTWSPDGTRIAFSSKRDDDAVPQIYVLDLVRGGEAQRATAISTGARKPVFSPDGSQIAFTSNVHRDARNDEDSQRIAAERKTLDYNVRTYTGFPIRNWDHWLDEDYQAHLFVQTLGETSARDLLAGTELSRQRGFGGRTTLSGHELDAVWAPDGRSLIFIASRNLDRSAYAFVNTDMWQVSSNGGEPRALTGEGTSLNGSWSEPSFSPDGRTLHVLQRIASNYVFNPTQLAMFDWPKATLRATLTLPDQRDVIGVAQPSGQRHVYVLGEDAGHVKLYRGSQAGGEAQLAFEMNAGEYLNLSTATRSRQPVLLANFDAAHSPPQLVRIDLSRGGHRNLTDFSAATLSQLDMAPVEHFWFESRAGRQIHNMLVRPPGFDPTRKYPLLVLMHGGPHTMWRDAFSLRWNYHLLGAPGYVVLLTNYKGSTGFGAEFARAIQSDPLKGPAEEINQAADEAIARYSFIDGERQCAGGASYGGHLANWLQSSTTRYRCLVSHAGLVSLASQWATSDISYPREVGMGGPPWQPGVDWDTQNPIRYAAQWRTPVLLTIGERDFRVPLNNTLEYWSALQRQQVTSKLVVYPEENHWILRGGNSRHFYGEVHQWLERWLLGQGSAASQATPVN